MTLSTVIIFATLVIFAAADPQCGAGELICNDATMGPTCYDPNTYSCPSGSRGTILCGFQEHGPDGACGTICYDMTDYTCCNEELFNAYDGSAPCAATSAPATPPAETSPMMCGGEQCLALYECCNDVTMGPTCYDPNGLSCPIGSKGPVLCGFQEHGADGACGTVCYDMVDYQCCNDKLYGIEEDTPCSTAVTSAPATSPATSAPTSPATTMPVFTDAPTAPAPMMCGGEQCLALYECCDDVTMGPTCYDPNGLSCPIGSKGPVLCGFQEHGADGACGTVCYDMVDYQCCNDKLYGIEEDTPCSSPETFVATSAPEAGCTASTCGTGLSCCDDANLGPVCFDAAMYSCPIGSEGPILCGFQEHGADGTCGSVCYDLVDYKCCDDQLYGADDESAPC